METFDFSAQSRIQYPIVIARGAVDQLGEILHERLPDRRRIVVISDNRVAKLYAEQVMAGLRDAATEDVELVTFSFGEASKSLATAKRLIDCLLEKQVDRRALVVALGGGVVCDTAGFTSSIYMRGISYINVPTSLMSQIDASIGGKVAVNHETGKNLIGQFWHPQAVVVDPELLRTLPAVEIRNGLAEIVKVSLIYSVDLFAELEDAGSRLVDEIGVVEAHDAIIVQAIKAKLNLLAPDPYEQGDLRRALNFGHTFAHPLEITDRLQLRHGFAVSIGMCIATMVAVERGLLPPAQGDRIFGILQSMGLPICGPPLDPEVIWNNSYLIRCIRANCLHYVVPVELGKVDFIEDLTKDEFISVYNNLRAEFAPSETED